MKFFLRKYKRQARVQPGELNPVRLQIISGFFTVLFIIVIFRAVMIHLFPASKENLESIAKHQYQKPLKLAAYRGSIFDHRRIPLAISVRSPSFAVNPKVFSPSPSQRRKLARLLRVSEKKIKQTSKKNRYFAWLKRKVDHKTAQSIRNLEIKGLFEILEPGRFYPGGSIASNLIGYVGLDNKGLFGLEARYNKELTGHNTEATLSRDARGLPIFTNPKKATPESPGHNIVLTIDRAIQEIAEEALYKWIKKGRASSGFALVADPHTGRILASANYPTFDPNYRNINIKNTKHFAIANVFEPGSVMKPMVIARALDSQMTSVNEIHNCEKNGVYKVGKRNFIRDDHPKEFLTTSGVISESSNICTFKIAKRIGAEQLFRTFIDFGIADRGFSLNLPGQNHGRISDWRHWRPIRFANISFGQGHLVTGLEIIRAYSVFANGGKLIRPYVVDRVESSDEKIISQNTSEAPRRVITPETAKIMRKILTETVESGTATKAQSEFFSTAGKTGTAEKVDPKTKAYSDHKRIASFAGFSPTKDPHIVVYVVVDEPKEKPYYGGIWAAPVFREIVDKTLRYLNVSPDKIETQTIGLKVDPKRDSLPKANL